MQNVTSVFLRILEKRQKTVQQELPVHFGFVFLKSTNQKETVYKHLHCFETSPLFRGWEKLWCCVLPQNLDLLCFVAKCGVKNHKICSKMQQLHRKEEIFII